MKWILPIFVLCLVFPNVYAEQFYYVTDHVLSKPPNFCALQFEDPLYPGVGETLIEKTENAIYDWKHKLQEHTRNYDGWNFSFEILTLNELEKTSKSNSCDILILYKPQPETEEYSNHLGMAGISYLALYTEITIYFLEPEIVTQKSFDSGNFNTKESILFYKENLDPYLDSTIKHEIGHAFGLDHPEFGFEDFIEIDNVFHSPSIMTPYDHREPLRQLSSEITDYDLRSMVNLYGEDGMNEYSVKEYYIEIIFGSILVASIFAMRKMSKKQVNTR